MKTTWSVVAVYDSTASRDRAVEFCDQLVERFWSEHGFDVSWWSFEELLEEKQAKLAAAKAAEAELIIFGAQEEQEIPLATKAWVERWLGQRGDLEGMLVGLLSTGMCSSAEASNHLYLRRTAHRAGMDYLTQLPESIMREVPESLESYSERAALVTSVLDEILHRPTAPPPPQLRS